MGERHRTVWDERHDPVIRSRLDTLETELSRVCSGVGAMHQYVRVRPAAGAAISESMRLIGPLAKTVLALSELLEALHDAMPDGPWIQK